MDPLHVSDDELLTEAGKLVGSHRAITARLVVCLEAIERRRLHLCAGFSSMFEFCTKQLWLSDGEAFRRILAARLTRRFPVIPSLLASGKIQLSGLELLRERLTDENHAELLGAASGKTKREVEALLAARFPRADVPGRMRQLREFEQLSEARFKVEFTASAALRGKLEQCRDLLSHANPTRDLEVVIERAVDLLLADLEKKRLGRIKRPRRQPSSRSAAPSAGSSSSKSGRVANAARRQVFERDGTRCTYVSADGRRCEATAFLELDHTEPRALGGGGGADNLRVRCRAHNQLWAEEVFGAGPVERARHFRQKKYAHGREANGGETGGSGQEQPASNRSFRASGASGVGVFEKVRLALTGLGFGQSEARRAIAAVAKLGGEAVGVEQAFREALRVATAAKARELTTSAFGTCP